MQPYFFPYIGYFSLIKHTDQFILLDEVQFIRHGWIERNRILKQDGDDWLYIKVPLEKHERNTKIKDIKINSQQNWRQKIIAQLQPYKKKARYFNYAYQVVQEILDNDFIDIVSLNKNALEITCNYLNIPHNIQIFSEMGLVIEPPNEPDEWALNICKAIGNVSEYWNPQGGMEFFNREKYKQNNIQLLFQNSNIQSYNQNKETFIPGLSIIDVMMFNSVEKIHEMLDDFELL
jgi:hypothetical protein